MRMQLRVQAVHGLEDLGAPEFDLSDARRLQHTAASRVGGVHLHDAWRNHGVYHDPRAAAHLRVGGM